MTDPRSKIVDLIKTNRNYCTKIANKDPALREWVLQNTLIPVEGNTWPEVVRSATFQETNICKHGNKRIFVSIAEGFRAGCGRANVCQCVRESVSNKVSETKQKDSPEKKAAITAKRVKTNLATHGVTNVGQTKKALNAHREFYANEKNVKSAVEKGKATKAERYGDENYNNPEQIKASKAKK